LSPAANPPHAWFARASAVNAYHALQKATYSSKLSAFEVLNLSIGSCSSPPYGAARFARRFIIIVYQRMRGLDPRVHGFKNLLNFEMPAAQTSAGRVREADCHARP
jgi:hypothetical protein